ncbi:MAG: 23S rRNA (uracil(1939)-C(5))-methyltransferase RlmD [Pseudomonadota bacterium]
MSRTRRRRLPVETQTADITEFTHDGRGIAHIAGKVTFITDALPGETVRFRYTRQRRDYDEGVVSEVIAAAETRVTPSCEHAAVCGGCRLQHLAPAAQVTTKQAQLLENLSRIGKVEPQHQLPPIVNDTPWGYRRKARLGVKYVHKKGRVLVGFRERQANLIADIQQCPVLHPHVGTRLSALARMIETLTLREQIPQIEVVMDDTQCVLIFRILTPIDEADRARLREFARQHDFIIYLQPAGPESCIPLEQPAVLQNRLPEQQITLHFTPGDFTQVNHHINRRMVSQALALLKPGPADQVLDLFCGIGNFTLPLARHAGQVTGVEGDAGLVQRARENAARNGLTNVSVHATNLYEDMAAAEWLQQRYTQALLDPPRSGARPVLAHLPVLGVQQILYVSCYPGTLARDAGILVHEHGYQLQSVGVMDMFPHTAHVESMALFNR